MERAAAHAGDREAEAAQLQVLEGVLRGAVEVGEVDRHVRLGLRVIEARVGHQVLAARRREAHVIEPCRARGIAVLRPQSGPEDHGHRAHLGPEIGDRALLGLPVSRPRRGEVLVVARDPLAVLVIGLQRHQVRLARFGRLAGPREGVGLALLESDLLPCGRLHGGGVALVDDAETRLACSLLVLHDVPALPVDLGPLDLDGVEGRGVVGADSVLGEVAKIQVEDLADLVRRLQVVVLAKRPVGQPEAGLQVGAVGQVEVEYP